MDETELLILNLRKEVQQLRIENAFLSSRFSGASDAGSAVDVAESSPLTLPAIDDAIARDRGVLGSSAPVPLTTSGSGKAKELAMMKEYVEEIGRLRGSLDDEKQVRSKLSVELQAVTADNDRCGDTCCGTVVAVTRRRVTSHGVEGLCVPSRAA